jgi:GTP cyclohydrolase II
MMRLADCARFAEQNALPLITVDAMVKYLQGGQDLEDAHICMPPLEEPEFLFSDLFEPQHIDWPKGTVELQDIGGGLDFVACTVLPTDFGEFKVVAYRDRTSKAEPIVFQVGNLAGKTDLPVRVHDQCITGEVFGSFKCDCRQQLHLALRTIRTNGAGAVIYLPQEGRGIGLANKIAAYSVQNELDMDTVDANRELGLPEDARKYDCVSAILKHIGVKSVALLTNNPRKLELLKELGVKVTTRIPCVVPPDTLSEQCMQYVNTKAKRMGHMAADVAVCIPCVDPPSMPEVVGP